MNARRHTKFVREGSYAAEVDVELIEEENGWSPYLSLDDARKLDDVREALRRGGAKSGSRPRRVVRLPPTPFCNPPPTTSTTRPRVAAPRRSSVCTTTRSTTGAAPF